MTNYLPIIPTTLFILFILFIIFFYYYLILHYQITKRKFKELSKKLYPSIATFLLIIVCFFLGVNIAFLISTYLDFIRTFHSPILWIILYLCITVGTQLNYVIKLSKNIKE